MSFAETEYPGILAEIERLLSGPNPLEGIERVKELCRIHNQIPLYPGLVGLVGRSVAEEKKAGELVEGDRVTWSDRDGFYAGVVAKVGSGETTVGQVVSGRAGGSARLDKEAPVTRFTSDALHRTWPSLSYPKKAVVQ
jgi:hypothetical protein